MRRQLVPAILLSALSAAFAQNSTTLPSQKEQINNLESTSTSPVKNDPKQEPRAKTNEPAATQNKSGADPQLGNLTSTALNQHVTPATALSNDELLARGKTVFVISNTFFVKKEELERGLLDQKDLQGWGFHVLQDARNADFILKVKRAPFQNNFPFTLSDRASGIVLMGGTVNSLFGTVPGKIAGRLADKFKEVYKTHHPQ